MGAWTRRSPPRRRLTSSSAPHTWERETMGHLIPQDPDVPLCPLCGGEGPLFPVQILDAEGAAVQADGCSSCAGYATLADAIRATQLTGEAGCSDPWARVGAAWERVAAA